MQHDGGYGFAEFDDREDARDAVKVSFVYLLMNMLMYLILQSSYVEPAKYATPHCLLKRVFAQDLDGSSFMGSRLRIEHSRDSRDSRRDRSSPPRGRFS